MCINYVYVILKFIAKKNKNSNITWLYLYYKLIRKFLIWVSFKHFFSEVLFQVSTKYKVGGYNKETVVFILCIINKTCPKFIIFVVLRYYFKVISVKTQTTKKISIYSVDRKTCFEAWMNGHSIAFVFKIEFLLGTDEFIITYRFHTKVFGVGLLSKQNKPLNFCSIVKSLKI